MNFKSLALGAIGIVGAVAALAFMYLWLFPTMQQVAAQSYVRTQAIYGACK